MQAKNLFSMKDDSIFLLTGLLGALVIVSGCSSMTTAEKENKRGELDAMAAQAITGLKKIEPDLQDKLDKSLAYGVANMKVTKVPIVGAGGGEGVFIVKKTQQRIYFTVGRFDVGGGWGARSYKALLIFYNQKLVDTWKTGSWVFEAGAEASAGTAALEGSSAALSKGFSMHVLSDGGASATATARIIRVKVNNELTVDP